MIKKLEISTNINKDYKLILEIKYMEENNEIIKNDHIIPVKIDEEMKSSYIDYSMSVSVSRALPDVRDGFKLVHRRVLFGMNELGNTSYPLTKK